MILSVRSDLDWSSSLSHLVVQCKLPDLVAHSPSAWPLSPLLHIAELMDVTFESLVSTVVSYSFTNPSR